MRVATEPFEVMDALGGEFSGNYIGDKASANEAGVDFDEDLYVQALQMSEQP